MQVNRHRADTLPEPDAESLRHSQAMAAFIREQIVAAGGSVSFGEFMQHALYSPGLGYYVGGQKKFGADGDFVTAPEQSSLFARVLARNFAAVLSELRGGTILELGAGSGALAVDLMQRLEELDALPDRYQILEISGDLQARQRARILARIPDLAARFEWLDDLPAQLSGIIVANEVADALPVERFVRMADVVFEQRVALTDTAFCWHNAAAPARLCDAVGEIEADLGQQLASGYSSEYSPALPGWIDSLAKSLAQGAIFIADYGVARREYYAPDRSDGWLRCHFRHRAHSDPLIHVGIQDLTCWIDFSHLAAAAAESGLAIAGYASQGQFLLHAGLAEELANFAEMPTDRQLELSRQVKLLTLPGEMGENFKCLALTRGTSVLSSIFSPCDRAHTL